MIVKNSITRAANITAYAAGQVINGNLATTPIALPLANTFLNASIVNNHLVSSNPAGVPAIDVYFFSNTFTIAADGVAFAPTADQMKDNFLGKISHSAWSAFAAVKQSSKSPEAQIEITPSTQFSGSPSVFVVLVAAGAYTPTSGEVITIKTDIKL